METNIILAKDMSMPHITFAGDDSANQKYEERKKVFESRKEMLQQAQAEYESKELTDLHNTVKIAQALVKGGYKSEEVSKVLEPIQHYLSGQSVDNAPDTAFKEYGDIIEIYEDFMHRMFNDILNAN